MYSFLEGLELEEEAGVGFRGGSGQSHEVERVLELHAAHHDQVGEDEGGRTRFACETIGGCGVNSRKAYQWTRILFVGLSLRQLLRKVTPSLKCLTMFSEGVSRIGIIRYLKSYKSIKTYSSYRREPWVYLVSTREYMCDPILVERLLIECGANTPQK